MLQKGGGVLHLLKEGAQKLKVRAAPHYDTLAKVLLVCACTMSYINMQKIHPKNSYNKYFVTITIHSAQHHRAYKQLDIDMLEQ